MAKKKPPVNIFQLKISLRDITPPIWRRVQIEDCTLGELHDIIQVCIGWEDSRLHGFDVGGVKYGDPTLDYTKDEFALILGEIVEGRKKKFDYTSDFGDGWRHVIQIEKRLASEESVLYPRCVEGERAGPPEDCGGAWGSESILTMLADPNNPEYQAERRAARPRRA